MANNFFLNRRSEIQFLSGAPAYRGVSIHSEIRYLLPTFVVQGALNCCMEYLILNDVCDKAYLLEALYENSNCYGC